MNCPDDYNVVMMGFPGDILAAVRVDGDGYPTVYINDFLSVEAKRIAMRHELWHFEHGDFTNHLTIYDAEKRAACCCPVDVMPKSYRPLSDSEMIRLMIAGAVMMFNAFDTRPEYDLPLPMPERLFDTPPEPNRFDTLGGLP